MTGNFLVFLPTVINGGSHELGGQVGQDPSGLAVVDCPCPAFAFYENGNSSSSPGDLRSSSIGNNFVIKL